MSRSQDIGDLEDLLSQFQGDASISVPGDVFARWKGRVRVVLASAFGEDSRQFQEFYQPGISIPVLRIGASEFETKAEKQERVEVFASGIEEAATRLETAIFELKRSNDARVDPHSFDPGLWAHVGSVIEAENWDAVASSAVTYTENQVREW